MLVVTSLLLGALPFTPTNMEYWFFGEESKQLSQSAGFIDRSLITGNALYAQLQKDRA